MSVPTTAPFPNPFAVAAMDAGTFFDISRGVSGVPVPSADASAGVIVTDSPAIGLKLVLTDLILSVGATAQTVTLKDADAVVVLGPLYVPANTTLQITPRAKLKLPTANKTLKLHTGASGNVSALVFYYSEA